MRPGEKLYEEPLADDETTVPTPNPKLRIAKARSADPDFLATFAAWCAEADVRSDEAVRSAIGRWVPEYHVARNGYGNGRAESATASAGAAEV